MHKAAASNEILEALKTYTSQIESLQETSLLTMVLVWGMDSKSRTDLSEFQDKYCAVRDDDEGNRHVSIPTEHFRSWNRLRHKRDQARNAAYLLPRSIFVSLQSQFDAFLSRLLRAIFIAKPELLNPSNREIAYSDLIEFESLESARDHIIEKEIDAFLRKSRTEQFTWMKERFGTTFSKFDSWPQFVEMSQRRNLFVHTDGVISAQYLLECRKAACTLDTAESTLGSKIGVSSLYFTKSASCMMEVGVKLAHVLLRRLFPDHLDASDKALTELSYELIDQKKYDDAITLLAFAVDLPKHNSELNRLMMVVNQAQALKWKGDFEGSKNVLAAEDWSALGENFQIAEAVLRNEWERASVLMRRIGKDGAIRKVDYRDWPLFREFRLREEFLATYEEVFGENFPKTVDSTENSPTTQKNEVEPDAEDIGSGS